MFALLTTEPWLLHGSELLNVFLGEISWLHLPESKQMSTLEKYLLKCNSSQLKYPDLLKFHSMHTVSELLL